MEEENVTFANRNLACHPELACTKPRRGVEGQTKSLSKNEGRKGYKKTKLGWIPKEWEIKKISEVGKILSGLTYSPNDISSNGTLVLRSSNVQDRQIKFEDNVYVKVAKNSFVPVEEKDILICVRNGSKSLIGKNALIPKEAEGMAFGAFMSILRSKHNNYFYQLFDTDFYNREIQKNLGATINSINGSNLKKFTFPFPPEDERQAIANCLSTWDSAIATLTQLIEKKQQAKKGLMQQLLSGKKRLPGFEGEWKVEPLSSFIKYSPREVDKPNGTFHKLGIRSHCKGTFLNEDFDSEKIAIDKMYVVEENDLIVNITFAWEGAIAIINKEHAKTYVSHRFPTYRFKKDVGSPEYFKQFIQSKKFKYLLELISPGGAGRNRVMSKKDFLKLKITVPNHDEQAAIAQVLQTADDEIGLLTQKLDALKEQKKGLMQVLLTGRKRLEY
jgi:type I restriction enzyme S subunit